MGGEEGGGGGGGGVARRCRAAPGARAWVWRGGRGSRVALRRARLPASTAGARGHEHCGKIRGDTGRYGEIWRDEALLGALRRLLEAGQPPHHLPKRGVEGGAQVGGRLLRPRLHLAVQLLEPLAHLWGWRGSARRRHGRRRRKRGWRLKGRRGWRLKGGQGWSRLGRTALCTPRHRCGRRRGLGLGLAAAAGRGRRQSGRREAGAG